MVTFNPKLVILEDDNTSMSTFKQLVAEKLFGLQRSNGDLLYSGSHIQGKVDLEKLKFFTFTGMEIIDDEELGILENNTYLFVSQGKTSKSHCI